MTKLYFVMLGVISNIYRTNLVKNLNSLIKVSQLNSQFVRLDHHQSAKMPKALVIVADGSEEMEAVSGNK